MAKKKLPDIKSDPRFIELAKCVHFALTSFRNKPMYDHKTKKMMTWHTWFKKALDDAGWKVE